MNYKEIQLPDEIMEARIEYAGCGSHRLSLIVVIDEYDLKNFANGLKKLAKELLKDIDDDDE